MFFNIVVKLGLPFRQCFVQPFAGHPDLACQLAHVAGAGNVDQRGANATPVAQIFLCSRFKIEAGIFLGAQVIGDIPAGE